MAATPVSCQRGNWLAGSIRVIEETKGMKRTLPTDEQIAEALASLIIATWEKIKERGGQEQSESRKDAIETTSCSAKKSRKKRPTA